MKKSLALLLSLLMAFSVMAQSGLIEAQDFFAKDVNAQSYELFDYLEEGKIVVLPFFTTNCGSCNIYTPEIVLSCEDFGCNQGDVFYLGINWGSNNIGVTDFINVHLVNYPCISGDEGLGNLINEQYEIASHITTLVITPNRDIVGQFYGPNNYPTRDTLNALLLSLGAQMENCTVGLEEDATIESSSIDIYPNPVMDHAQIALELNNSSHYQLNIIHSSGQILYTQKDFIASEKNKFNINLETFPKGVYLLQLIDDWGQMSQKKFLKI